VRGDQQSALTQAKLGDRTPPAQTSTCNMPIADQHSMGMNVGMSGTPAIMKDDGSMIHGYHHPERLLAWLRTN